MIQLQMKSLKMVLFRLRKVKMDQRKLMDNANTITDMAKVNYTLQTALHCNMKSNSKNDQN